MPTKQQALTKLSAMAEQMRKHAEAHSIQVVTYFEGPDGQVLKNGHFTEELIVNVAADLSVQHPSAVRRARAFMMDNMGRKEVEQAEA